MGCDNKKNPDGLASSKSTHESWGFTCVVAHSLNQQLMLSGSSTNGADN